MKESQSAQNQELIIRVDEKVAEVLRRLGKQDDALAALSTRIDSVYQDLNRRVTVLESFRWWLLGALGIVTAAVQIIVNKFWKE